VPSPETLTRFRPPLSAERLARIAIEERGAIQKHGELRALLELIAVKPPTRLLEVGTAAGGALWAFCQVAHNDALIVCLDLPDGPFGGGWSEAQLRRFPNFCRGAQRVVALPLDSHDPASVRRVRDAVDDEPLDFLFIDADHRYESVKRDFEMYSPLVAPGGLIALHDILPNSDYQGSEVELLWTELRTRYRTQELVAEDERLDMGRWGGIGVLWMPDETGLES